MHGTPAEAMTLAREYPSDQMQIVQTGYEKEDQLVSKLFERERALLMHVVDA